jgi:hypothetical protein
VALTWRMVICVISSKMFGFQGKSCYYTGNDLCCMLVFDNLHLGLPCSGGLDEPLVDFPPRFPFRSIECAFTWLLHIFTVFISLQAIHGLDKAAKPSLFEKETHKYPTIASAFQFPRRSPTAVPFTRQATYWVWYFNLSHLRD